MSSNDRSEFAVGISLTLAYKCIHLLGKILKDVLIFPELLTQYFQASKACTGPYGPSLNIVMEGLQ